MSDTPRTDAHASRMRAHLERWDLEYHRHEGEVRTPWPAGLLSDHDFARTLERELAAVTAERDALHRALARLVELKDMKERAKRDNDGWVESEYYRTRAAAWDAARAALRRP